jgi:hypothetical protein
MTRSQKSQSEGSKQRCFQCQELTKEFSKTQSGKGQERVCKSCVEKSMLPQTTKTCKKCKTALSEDNFSKRQWKDGAEATCVSCMTGKTFVAKATKTCQECKKTLPREGNFRAKEWKDHLQPTCEGCISARAAMKTCSVCKLEKPRPSFSQLEAKTPSYMEKAKLRKCNECLDQEERAKTPLRGSPKPTKASSSTSSRKR